MHGHVKEDVRTFTIEMGIEWATQLLDKPKRRYIFSIDTWLNNSHLYIRNVCI
jgi:hypothetical protein